MCLNEAEKDYALERHKFWLLAKHTKLYAELLQDYKSEPVIALLCQKTNYSRMKRVNV